MEYPGFMHKAVFQFMLRLEGKHAEGLARQQIQVCRQVGLSRLRAEIRYADALQVNNLVENNDPACLWD